MPKIFDTSSEHMTMCLDAYRSRVSTTVGMTLSKVAGGFIIIGCPDEDQEQVDKAITGILKEVKPQTVRGWDGALRLLKTAQGEI